MSLYLLDIGNSLAKVLELALRSQPEQFAGYFANFEFWTAEFNHVRDVADGYEQRYKVMAQARNDYLAQHGAPHNRDDSVTPYQGVKKTTKKQGRNAVVAQCRLALEKWIARALKCKLITIKRHDELLQIILKR